jgi:drug/metabolite transporter (DMT)-like permease
MAYLLALASAALYGSADFVGGLASRRAATVSIVLVSQAIGLVLLGAVLPLLPAAAPARPDVAWGAAAGLAGGTGVALLYRALAVGVMAIVAPVTAVCAVIIPVGVDLLEGRRPGIWVLGGIALAIVSIVLVSQPGTSPADASPDGPVRDRWPGSRPRPRGLGLALLSGVAIGIFYLALARTGESAGLWPLAAARAMSVTLFCAIAVAARIRIAMPLPIWGMAAGGGALDMAANALYLLATRRGALSTVVTLASLYPASTVVLASALLRERLSRVQWAGILCALVAVALIVGGES